jgi:DNA-binding transcriptional LysR family regulator
VITTALPFVPLYEERYWVATRADGPLAARVQVDWAELAAQPLCLLTPDMQNCRIIDGHLDVGARPRSASNSVIVLISHGLAGGWATILPVVTAAFFLDARADLRAVPIHGPDARHAVGLIAPDRARPAALVVALMRQAETAIEGR